MRIPLQQGLNDVYVVASPLGRPTVDPNTAILSTKISSPVAVANAITITLQV